jgi:serine/threonine-protein kinase
MAPVIGRTVGNYVVLEMIGSGGMGAVYLAEHPRIRRKVAIKVLLPELSRNSQVVARFFNEAKAANEIHNDHIIDIIDFGEMADDGSSYIIMEFLDGTPLSGALKQAGKLPLARALHIVRGIARALSAAHARGIVHRDLKPDNVFLITRGEDRDFVKVLDFGIAKLTQQDSTPELKTQTGALMGTPLYMAPEQCRGLAIDTRADIYALGVMLHQMLAGKVPFEAEGLGELLLHHMTKEAAPLRTLEPSVPAHVEAAVLRALAKEPDQRFQRVEEMMVALGDSASGAFSTRPEPATASRTSSSPSSFTDTIGAAAGQREHKTQPGAARSRAALLVGGALVIAAGAAAVVLTRHPPSAPTTHEVPAASAPPVAAPVAAPTPPVTAPAPPVAAAPATSHVRIHATPAAATVLLDDAPVGNPFDGEFPRSSVRHRLEVRAPGFRSDSRWLTFESDAELSVALEKGAGAHEHRDAHKPAAAVELPRPPAAPSAAPVEKPKTAPKPVEEKADAKKPIYKGTKGKIITDYPSE